MTDPTAIMRWDVGRVRISRIEECIVPLDWERLIPAAPALLEGCAPWIDPYVSDDRSQLLLSIHSFVVETPDTCMVIDTCIGRDDLTFAGDPGFGERLNAALPGGLDGVDVVICTHLHFDHIGWNTVEVDGRLVPRFPNASYLVTAAELASTRDAEDGSAVARSVEPLRAAGCLDEVDADHRVDRWVTLEPTPGHTPGHVSVRIADGGDTAYITGDIVHSPVQLAHPDAAARSDGDPALAIETRTTVIESLMNSDTLVLGTHFPPPTAGRLRRLGDQFDFG